MTFEEYKERCEEHFGRSLSDKEVAEVAVNALSEWSEVAEGLKENLKTARTQNEQLRNELAYTGENEAIKETASKLTEILDIPGDSHEFQLRFYKGKLVNFMYKVAGSMEFYDEGE